MRKIVPAFVAILSITFVFASCSRQPSTNNPINTAASPTITDFPICGPDTRARIMLVTGLTTPQTAKVNTPFDVTVSATNTGGCHARQASTSINLSGAAGGQMIITYTNLDKGDKETNQRSITATKTGDLKVVAFSFVEVGSDLVNNEPEGRQERIVKIIP